MIGVDWGLLYASDVDWLKATVQSVGVILGIFHRLMMEYVEFDLRVSHRSNMFPGRLWIYRWLEIIQQIFFSQIGQMTKRQIPTVGPKAEFHRRWTRLDTWFVIFDGGYLSATPHIKQSRHCHMFFFSLGGKMPIPWVKKFGIGISTMFTGMCVQCFDDFIVLMSWVQG